MHSLNNLAGFMLRLEKHQFVSLNKQSTVANYIRHTMFIFVTIMHSLHLTRQETTQKIHHTIKQNWKNLPNTVIC